ncbi:MAG: tRNA lysidine(34) synthetase TilS [Lentisphaeria bacterium]|nr:tRNA lysidine(34) synthetase TilS [Lentisphaeria bacterium]
MKNRNLSTSWKNSNNLPLLTLPPEKQYFLAFSGGADSTALLLLLKQNHIPFTAIHFTHGIRCAESGEKERRFCAEICKKLQIPLRDIPLDVMKNKLPDEGIEEAARRLRLEAWKNITSEQQNSIVLTAHHSNDAVENMLLRLMRGGNTSSITSLQFITEVEGMIFCRPLLYCTKQQLIDYLQNSGIREWITDETNADSSYFRNFLRNEILPEINQHIHYAEGGFRAAYQALSQDAEYLQQTADALPLSDDRTFWEQLHPAIRARVLRRYLTDYFQCDMIPSQTLLLRFAAALKQKNSCQRLPVPGKKEFLYVDKNKVCILKPEPLSAGLPDVSWNWQNDKTLIYGNMVFTAEYVNTIPDHTSENECYCDADQLDPVLFFAPPQQGETIHCFGSNSSRKLKKLFTDAGISALEKKSYPVLRTVDHEILWIPALRRSSLAVCTENTEKIVRFRAVKNPSTL